MNQALLEVARFYFVAEAAYWAASWKLRVCVYVCVWCERQRETANRVDWIIYSAAGVRSTCTQLPESLKWFASFLSCHSCITHTHICQHLWGLCFCRVVFTEWVWLSGMERNGEGALLKTSQLWLYTSLFLVWSTPSSKHRECVCVVLRFGTDTLKDRREVKWATSNMLAEDGIMQKSCFCGQTRWGFKQIWEDVMQSGVKPQRAEFHSHSTMKNI